MSLSELIIDIPAEYEMNVFGQFDTYIKKIERTFHVTLISRDGATKIVGDTIAAQKAQRVLTQLVELAKRGNTITEQNVDYAISLVFEDQEDSRIQMIVGKDNGYYTWVTKVRSSWLASSTNRTCWR